MTFCNWLLFTKAGSRNLISLGSTHYQHFLYAVSTTITQGQVVLTAATLIGIAFYNHFTVSVCSQKSWLVAAITKRMPSASSQPRRTHDREREESSALNSAPQAITGRRKGAVSA